MFIYLIYNLVYSIRYTFMKFILLCSTDFHGQSQPFGISTSVDKFLLLLNILSKKHRNPYKEKYHYVINLFIHTAKFLWYSILGIRVSPKFHEIRSSNNLNWCTSLMPRHCNMIYNSWLPWAWTQVCLVFAAGALNCCDCFLYHVWPSAPNREEAKYCETDGRDRDSSSPCIEQTYRQQRSLNAQTACEQ